MEKHPLNFSTPCAEQHATLVRYATYADDRPPRRLLLLHGAGVAGEVTWTYLANYLTEWDEVLIPDFAGMGKSRFSGTFAPRVADYVRQIEELLSAIDWQVFDVAGYSFGGMITARLYEQNIASGLCFLMEPAMLFSSDCGQIRRKADDYLSVADAVDDNPDNESAYFAFLDSVSPARARDERTDQLTIARIKANAQGFAAALRAVSQVLLEECATFSSWIPSYPGMSFVGDLSHATMQGRHRLLAEQAGDWGFELVPNADHSLVFTKPRFIAKAMNERKRQISAD
ncbi:alpha/beta fold hydrolase [Thalassolituus sp. LLYu03]|uniref:alpha/beta fold hydrolase n=1 Tax=Thalassolituus sp. LLYu03 TaxID=3421656 RepID=UPI003D2CAD44